MHRFHTLLFVCFIYIHSAFALETADRDAIQDIIESYTKAWNDHEGKGFGEGYAKDADFVNIFGMYFVGKDEIEFRHVKILQSFLKDSKLDILSTKLREVQPGLVVAIVKWKVDKFRQPGSDISLPESYAKESLLKFSFITIINGKLLLLRILSFLIKH